jgi:BarA-like signal transduction histidine kinase
MALSMLDQMLFNLPCKHLVVLGRLAKTSTWKCEQCGQVTDLRIEPILTELESDLDMATQIDLHARERGETIVRAD